MITQKATVLSVSRYNFTDSSTGEVIKGCKIIYLTDQITDDSNRKGFNIITENIPYEFYDKIQVNTSSISSLSPTHALAQTLIMSGKKPSLKIQDVKAIPAG